MTDRELLKMALEALGDSGYKADPMAAAAALRAALAEPVQEPIPLNDGRLWQYPDGSIGIGKLAEPVQEPEAPARRPLTSNKDVPGAIYVDGYGYVDIKAVRAIERAHNITGGNDE